MTAMILLLGAGLISMWPIFDHNHSSTLADSCSFDKQGLVQINSEFRGLFHKSAPIEVVLRSEEEAQEFCNEYWYK